MLFPGSFRHAPNLRGFEWFAAGVLARVRARFPEARVVVVGSEMGTHSIAGTGVEMRGFVDDVREPLSRYAVFVCPVLTGSVYWAAIGYAVLSLTVVRMLPVALSLTGLGMHRSTWLFMGWFGPRGLASVVFTLVALEDLHTDSPEQSPLIQVASWTILLSVLAHGLTAGFLAPRYGAAMSALGDIPEMAPAHEPRMRSRSLTRHRTDQGESPGPGPGAESGPTADPGGGRT